VCIIIEIIYIHIYENVENVKSWTNFPRAHTHTHSHSTNMSTVKGNKTLAVLRELQAEHDELEQDYRIELEQLERKYRLLYEPLYAERYKELNDEPVPAFWCTAMRNHPMIKELIEPVDIPVLEYLDDIRCKWNLTDDCTLHMGEDGGFSRIAGFGLHFVFRENPFFGPPYELSKWYHLDDDPRFAADPHRAAAAPKVLESIDASVIQWNPGQDITKKQVTRKQKNKRTKQVRKLIETISVPSFFNFFTKHELPTQEEMDTMALEKVEELECVIEQDYEIGRVFRDKIIPRAVDWYSGDAVDSDMDMGSGDSDDERAESDEESGDSDEDSDEDPRKKSKRRGKREEQANCKQQ